MFRNLLRTFHSHSQMFKYESRLNNKIKYYCTGAGGAKIKNPITEEVKPSDWQKKMLLWTGKFKNANEIPPTVSRSSINQAESKMRIKTANIMMVLTLIACVFTVASGKKKAERGETVVQINRDFHKEYNSKLDANAGTKQ